MIFRLVFQKTTLSLSLSHADVRASAVMTHVNNDDADDLIFDHTLCEILGDSSRVATSLDLDLAFGAVDVNDDLACTFLLSPLCPLPPLIASPPPSAAAGEPTEIQEFSLS